MGAVGAEEGLLGEIVRLAGPERSPDEVAIDLPVVRRHQGIEAFSVHPG